MISNLLIENFKVQILMLFSCLVMIKTTDAQCADPTGLIITNITEDAVSFSWTAVSGVTGYEYAVANSSTAPASGTATSLTSASKTFTFDDPDYYATRYIYVRATCTGGLFSNWTTICKATPNSLGGSGTYCPNGTINVGIPTTLLTQTYTWIRTNDNSIKKGPTSGNGDSQSYNEVLTASEIGNYKVTTDVTGAPGCQSTDFGNVIIYMLTSPPGLTITNVNDNSVSFSWDAIAGVDSYLFVVDENSDNPDITGTPTFPPSISSTSATVINLNPSQSLYIHVRGVEPFSNGGDCSTVWSTLQFSTAPLPINIEFFKAKKINSGNYIEWKANCSGFESTKFEVERSADGHTFNTIHISTATLQQCNQPMSFTDNQPLRGINYYRLRMVENTGKVSYSSIIKLGNNLDKLAIIILPNPVHENGELQISLEKSSKVDVVISDMIGKVLITPLKGMQLSEGLNQIPLKTAALIKGIYLCRILINGEVVRTLKLIKQ
ncbi:MAG: T9SS type A sorting domain-containing protein [Ferruginibacter sp.]